MSRRRPLLLLVAALAVGFIMTVAPRPQAAPSGHAMPRSAAAVVPAGWSAGEHGEGGGRVCYASTRSARAQGAAGSRGAVLIVARRAGRAQDWVAIAPGYALVRDARVEVTVGPTKLAFRSEGGDAFAHDGRAAVRAFLRGREVTAVVRPGPGGREGARFIFPLAGFGTAFGAISRACPTG